MKTTLILGVAAALIAGSCFANVAKPHPVQTLRITQDVAACKAQPQLPWCNPVATKSAPVTIALVNATEAQARRNFTFQDKEVDTWGSLADRVIAGKSWSGNCDSMTFTLLEMLARRGVSPDHLWRVIVNVTTTDDQGNRVAGKHMIGVVLLDDGTRVVVGDARDGVSAPYDLTKLSNAIFAVNHVSGGIIWTLGEGDVEPPFTPGAPIPDFAQLGN